MAQPQDERQARKAYVRQRQRTVFTIVGATMAVVLLFSSLVFTGVIDLEPDKKVTVQPNFGKPAPCAAKQDGKAMEWPANSAAPVRVLNGTKFRGLANAVGEALQQRQFNVTEIATNKDMTVERTTIYFGENAINNAYQVARNFTDAQMVMDDRSDRLIDIVLGATFNDLRDETEMQSDGKTIKDFEGCLTIDELKQQGLPKADNHKEMN